MLREERESAGQGPVVARAGETGDKDGKGREGEGGRGSHEEGRKCEREKER